MSTSTITAIVIVVGTVELVFNVDHDDFNRLINEQDPGNKVGPTYNFLARTIAPESKDDLKRLCLTDSHQPKGLLVLQIAGLITKELGADVEVSVKKPAATHTD